MKKLIFLLLVLPTLNALGQTAPDISLIFYIDENSVSSTLIGTVSATDPDGDPLTYSITSGNIEGAFALDAVSGQITVDDESQLDYEATPSFTFMVEADDGNGGMTVVSITVNLNDIDEDVLGVGDNDAVLTAYPNPVREVLTVDLGAINTKGLEIAVYTLGGSNIPVVPSFVSDTKVEIDATLFGKGFHFLQVRNDEMVRTLRIWKN